MKPVVLARRAQRQIIDATAFYESRKQGLGGDFTDRVAEAVENIKIAPEAHQIVHGDVRRAVLRQFKDFSLWYRVLPDNSVVVACLNNRMAPGIVKEQALGVVPITPNP